MSTLEKLILNELGPLVLAWPDPLQQGWSFPICEVTDEQKEVMGKVGVKEIRQAYDLLDRIEDAYQGDWVGRTLASARIRKFADIQLAARMYDHDLAQMLNNARVNREVIDLCGMKAQLVNAFFNEIASFRYYCSVMRSLASAGEGHSMPAIPLSHIDQVIPSSKSHYYTDRLRWGDIEGDVISSTDYVILDQLVKNAEGEEFEVNVTAQNSSVALWVGDNGPGIYDTDGMPLRPHKIPRIFGSFSTRAGGGLGLQLVRRLTELQRGYVRVFTTTTLGSFEYDSRNGKIDQFPWPSGTGTTFMVHMPLSNNLIRGQHKTLASE